MTQAEIAEIVGVNRYVIGRWIKLWKSEGLKALKPTPKGRPHGTEKNFKPYSGKGNTEVLSREIS